MDKLTIEQQRAKYALGRINGILNDREKNEKRAKYLTDLRHLPSQLHWGGLGQTAASLLSDQKSNPQRRDIYDWIEGWLRERKIYAGERTSPKLIEAIAGIGEGAKLADKYVAATREARALAVWLKKFAEAFLQPATSEAKDEERGGHGTPAPR